jgi:hypothetical protein
MLAALFVSQARKRRPKLAGAPSRAPGFGCRGRLEVEAMEDRLVPGEALTALLLSPMGLPPLRDLLGPSLVGDDSSSVADAAAPAAEPGASLFADADGAPTVQVGLSALPGGGEATAPVRAARTEGGTNLAATGLLAGLPPASNGAGLDASILSPFAEAPVAQTLPGADTPGPGDRSGAGPLTFSAPMGASVGTGAFPTASLAPGGTPSADAGPSAPPAVGEGAAAPMLLARPAKHHGGGGGTPAGYSPGQIRHAYGFDKLTQNGTGQTIALVDAYDDPNITSDLNTFSTQFGLPTTTSGAFTFTKAYAQGSKPTANGGWAQEISLDVEWAHAIAPHANILLVEAASNSFSDLLGGVDYAVSHGAHAVSMSWGAGDFSGESGYDSHFNVSGVTFLASSGDSGGQVIYPSASPYVVSVGGTHLPLDSSGNLTGAETAWSSGGGGPSAYEAEPGYQTGYHISLSGRGTPDVSYNADPNTGVAVYDSYAYFGQSGWLVFGGTSAGAPQWAGLVALADQGRATPLSSNNLTISPEYNAATGTVYASNYRDITSGSNGYAATTGYDLATGLGSPLANNLVPYLASH